MGQKTKIEWTDATWTPLQATIPSNHRLAERKLIHLVHSGAWRIDENGYIGAGCRRIEHPVPAGYMQVRKMIAGVRIYGLAHRLVWQYFFGDIPPGMVINHLNGIKSDNRIANLQVCTMSENLKHAHINGLLDQHGQSNPAAKLSNNQVGAIRTAYAAGGHTMEQLATRFGISFQHVSKLIAGSRRTKQGGATFAHDLRHSVCDRDAKSGKFISKAAGRLLDGVEWNEVPNEQ